MGMSIFPASYAGGVGGGGGGGGSASKNYRSLSRGQPLVREEEEEVFYLERRGIRIQRGSRQYVGNLEVEFSSMAGELGAIMSEFTSKI